MADYLISGPTIYTEHETLSDHCLTTHEEMIESISKEKSKKSHIILEFPQNYHLIPGFIDLHVHGVNGFDVMDGTPEALLQIKKALVKEGVTGFLATTMTASQSKLTNALTNIQTVIKDQQKEHGALILGTHLEGPFISQTKKGAQSSEFIVPADILYFKTLQAVSGNTIKLVTLAPEIKNMLALVDYLKQQKIIASIGHTNATFAETIAAINKGCSYATHLFNAMRSIHQREPGAAIAALLSNEVSVELIADGVHLHPAIIELVMRTKPLEKILLVTDAMRAKCLSDGCYELGGQSVNVQAGLATLTDGTLAGSVLSMPQALKNISQWTSTDLSTLLKISTENQAKLLGLFDQVGSLAAGKQANLVVLNESLEVVLTMVLGTPVFPSLNI